MYGEEDRHGGARMICPRCGIEQAKAVECANCGVVVAKWKPQTARGPRLRQAGSIGAVLVFLALIVVFVVVVSQSGLGAKPPAPAPVAPVGPSATERVMEDFWSSGMVGLRASSEDQRARKVAILVWFRNEGCAPCRAVEAAIFEDAAVDAWLSQNNRVRIDPDAAPDNKEIAEKFGVTTLPAAFLIRSDGIRKPIEVLQADGATPRPAAEWLEEARKLAGR